MRHLVVALLSLSLAGCALHLDGVSAGFMRRSKADPEQPKPAPTPAPVAAVVPSSLALKALLCSGRFTDRELLNIAATDPQPTTILAAIRSCEEPDPRVPYSRGLTVSDEK